MTVNMLGRKENETARMHLHSSPKILMYCTFLWIQKLRELITKKTKFCKLLPPVISHLNLAFNQYILPSCPMGKDVTQLNGLRMHKGNLQWNRKAVCADHCGAILENFLAYLDELK